MRIKTITVLLLAGLVAAQAPTATADDVVSVSVEGWDFLICVLESICVSPEGVCFTDPEPDYCLIIGNGQPPCIVNGVCPEPPPCFPSGCIKVKFHA